MDEDEEKLLSAALEMLQRRAARRTSPPLTVRQLFEQYKAAWAQRKSWVAYETRLIPFVLAHGDKSAADLTVMTWTLYASARRATRLPGKRGARGECYSETTVNAELGALKACLNWAVEQGLLRFNPLAVAKRKSRPRRETVPREREMGLALDACRTREQTLMVLAAGDVGLRRGEIIQLRHDWIDHGAKTVTLPNWACKNKRGGTVPCTQRFLDAVDALPRHIRHPQVLVSELGDGPYGRTALDDWWSAIRERAGLEAAPGEKAMRLHDLRAGAATNALKRGVRFQTVSKRILRHSTLATTEIYLRGLTDDPADASEAAALMEAGIVRDQQAQKRRVSTPE